MTTCGRNITLLPNSDRMEMISRTLKSFSGESDSNQEVDRDILTLLGEPTEVKRWLTASLDKFKPYAYNKILPPKCGLPRP